MLAFPCNQFGKQEPGSPGEIAEFAARYGAKFWMGAKCNVAFSALRLTGRRPTTLIRLTVCPRHQSAIRVKRRFGLCFNLRKVTICSLSLTERASMCLRKAMLNIIAMWHAGVPLNASADAQKGTDLCSPV